MLLGEPMLANREPETLPRPYVKWSYQPVRAVDVPAAVTRGISIAMQPPMGPVWISVPWDDWDVPMSVPVLPRSVSTRFGPDPERLSMFAERIIGCAKLGLVLGPEVDKALAWDDAVTLAEMFESPVFQSPMSERAVFPETHKLYRGPLPTARGPLGDCLEPFDLVLVLGAEVFRYYPWISGAVLPDGTRLLQITEDPNDSAKALAGDSLLSDVGLALRGLVSICKAAGIRPKSNHQEVVSHVNSVLDSHISADGSSHLMTAFQAFEAVAELRPSNAILVHETPSNTADLLRAWPSIQPESCFTFASGGLGWNGPAAVGVALAQKMRGTGRPTILAIGDGSFQYSLQSIYTAVRHKVKLIYLVPINEEYAVLKEFAELENTPNVPGLDIPGLNLSATAQAFGCPAERADTKEELQVAFEKALRVEGPFLIEFPIDRTLRPLVARTIARG